MGGRNKAVVLTLNVGGNVISFLGGMNAAAAVCVLCGASDAVMATVQVSRFTWCDTGNSEVVGPILAAGAHLPQSLVAV